MRRILVSGCYDILHAGHVQFLEDAKRLGDSLIVCIPSDRVIRKLKGRHPALPQDNRVVLMYGLRPVDVVVVGDSEDPVMNFVDCLQPGMILVSTDDDAHADRKREYCESIGAEYIQIHKTKVLCTPTSTTEIRSRLTAPGQVPLRVDFAGGWLDVPKYAREGAYVVNCAISPTVSVGEWGYRSYSGLGGSAAAAVLAGKDPIASELQIAGWQDAAVIQQTGLCVWRSAQRPVLDAQVNCDFLRGKMAIEWSGSGHSTGDLVDRKRDYDTIAKASVEAREAVMAQDVQGLMSAVQMSYEAQLDEGMTKLGRLFGCASKYLGSGHGGYILRLFYDGDLRDRYVAETCDARVVEPYSKW